MRNLFLLSALSLTISACAESPCAEYIDAVCECGDDHPDCDEAKKAYSDPTPDDDEECSAALDDAKENAESCDTGGSEG